MVSRFCCANIFSKNAGALINFYKNTLGIPVLKTDDDGLNGVYFGFSPDSPAICVWDCDRCATLPTGRMSFVFECEDIDATVAALRARGAVFEPPVLQEWGTCELRMCDPDGNETVIVKFKEPQVL